MTKTFKLKIDYNKSLARMVINGKYDYVNSDINGDNFPTPKVVPKAEVEAVLVHPNRAITSDEVLAEMEREDLRPATMAELLAFGEQYPDSQRQFPIIALGSVWASPGGSRSVGYLWESPDGRELDLDWCDGRWDEGSRFLAVRKSPSESGNLGTDEPLEKLPSIPRDTNGEITRLTDKLNEVIERVNKLEGRK